MMAWGPSHTLNNLTPRQLENKMMKEKLAQFASGYGLQSMGSLGVGHD